MKSKVAANLLQEEIHASVMVDRVDRFACDNGCGGRAAVVSYHSGDETVQATLYMPKGEGPFLRWCHPRMVGLNDWVKQQASNLADQGYVALAIDLYRGQVATTPDEAHQIMRGVPEDRANRDLLAATAYLRSLKEVYAKHVGAIGWCMGGATRSTWRSRSQAEGCRY